MSKKSGTMDDEPPPPLETNWGNIRRISMREFAAAKQLNSKANADAQDTNSATAIEFDDTDKLGASADNPIAISDSDGEPEPAPKRRSMSIAFDFDSPVVLSEEEEPEAQAKREAEAESARLRINCCWRELSWTSSGIRSCGRRKHVSGAERGPEVSKGALRSVGRGTRGSGCLNVVEVW
jgi:hypothetical protein